MPGLERHIGPVLSPPGKPTSSHTDLIERFRADRRSLPLHPAEKRLLWILGAHLCFLPWALGTMHAWSQVTSLVLAFLGFVVAALPRDYSGDYALPMSIGPRADSDPSSVRPPSSVLRPPTSAFRLHPWSRLLRFPVFWLGLALLAYIAVQGHNPSWIWERNATQWWLRRVNDIAWLPTSVDTPWERFNLWRQFIIYASAWLVVCSLWIGLTRRRSLQVLLFALAANGCLLLLAAVSQRIAGRDFLLEAMGGVSTGASFATFIYHNHAGAYFSVIMALFAGLAVGAFEQGERALRKSTPAGILAFGALAMAGAVLFTASRAAALGVAVYALALPGWVLWRNRTRPGDAGSRAVTWLVILVFVGVVGYTARQLDYSRIVGKFDRLLKEQTHEESARARLAAHEAAGEMLSEHWQRGVGAGAFRFLFPEYIRKHPEVYLEGRLFWEHAHNDWLQIPIELGLAGGTLLAAMAVWLLAGFARGGVLRHPVVLPVTAGLGLTLLHAWVDFPFQCPAILCTWLSAAILSLRWLELESAGRSSES